MDCPVCKTAMITLELDNVEIDYCLDCTGIWLDRGELEMLLNDAKNAENLIASFEKAQNCTEELRKCPICLKKMQKITVGTPENSCLIDKCAKGDGLWFDGGELKQVLTIGEIDENNKIINLLADMFGQQSQTP